MAKIVKEKAFVQVDTKPQEVRVRVWKDGSIKIKAYFLSKETLEAIAEITGKTIQGDTVTHWVEFARAEDKSRVTLFQK